MKLNLETLERWLWDSADLENPNIPKVLQKVKALAAKKRAIDKEQHGYLRGAGL